MKWRFRFRRMPAWVQIKGIKEFFWPSAFLISAFILAVLSSMARRSGQYYAAGALAVISLIFAFVVCVTLLPRLVARLKLDFLNNLRFFRFTHRGAFFILIVLIISFATFNTGNNLLVLILSFLLASLVASGIVAKLVLFGLKISLSIPVGIHAKRKAIFLITLHNLKKVFPSFALRLKGEKQGGGDVEGTDFFVQEKIFPYVRAGEKLRLRLHCEFRRRGIYPLQGFDIRTTFPFGLFWRGKQLDACGDIVVYPELCDLHPFFLQYPYVQGVEHANRRGWGSELYNVRFYQRDDDARFVHWKATAKLARLMVKDFAREKEQVPFNVFFSTYLPDCSPSNLEQFEKAVSYIASLGDYYRGKGQRFRFSSGEFEVAVNGRTEEIEAFMKYLAQVQPAERPHFDSREATAPCIVFWAGDAAQLGDIPYVDYLQL